METCIEISSAAFEKTGADYACKWALDIGGKLRFALARLKQVIIGEHKQSDQVPVCSDLIASWCLQIVTGNACVNSGSCS